MGHRNLSDLVAERRKINETRVAPVKTSEEEKLRKARTESVKRLEAVLSDLGVEASVELSPSGYQEKGVESAVAVFYFEFKKVCIYQPTCNTMFYFKVDDGDLHSADRPLYLVAGLVGLLGGVLR